MTDKVQDKAIEMAFAAINKAHGTGSICMADEEGAYVEHTAIPTGSIGLDKALGIGGVAEGRIIEIYGPEASGKTTLALQIIAQAQKQGHKAAFVDAEHALDLKYAEHLGVVTSDLAISQPETGESALEIVDTLVSTAAFKVIVIDSVAALVPKAELEGEMGKSHVGLQARLMSQALRKLTGAANQTNTTIIFINQIRMKIGVMFGNPETTSGGNALKYYCSQRIDIRRIGFLKHGEDIIGNRTRFKVVKNRMAPPHKQWECDLVNGKGIDLFAEILDIGVADGLITKNGSWYSYGDDRIGQGREKAINGIKLYPNLIEQIAGKQYVPAEEEDDEEKDEQDKLDESELDTATVVAEIKEGIDGFKIGS